MKKQWKKIVSRSLILLLFFFIITLQSSAFTFKIEGVKINLIFTIIVTIMLMGSINFALLLSLGVGFVYDILSSNEMGFYMASYFISIFPLIFWIYRIRSNLILSLFLLIVFVLITFKMLIEMVLLTFIYGIETSFIYFKGIGLLEVVFTTFISIVPYALVRMWERLYKRYGQALS